MHQRRRFISAWPFPPYAFIPGIHPHPKKLGGHSEGVSEPQVGPIDLEHPDENLFFRYGLDLLNYGYYWESHVYFESLWNTHKRQGSVADLLKALIKLGAAGVKLSMGQNERADEHFNRAKELLISVSEVEGIGFLDFDLPSLIHLIEMRKIEVYPNWKIPPL